MNGEMFGTIPVGIIKRISVGLLENILEGIPMEASYEKMLKEFQL